MDLYSISTNPDPNRQKYPPSDWLEGEGWPLVVLADSDSRDAAITFGLTAYPYSVFVYADGTIAARATGAIPYASFMEAVAFLAANPTAP